MNKEDQVLVSIIMNCHNGEKYLKESIDSVIDQTYSNWELIFFNNLSDDNSLSILELYNDKRIRIFNSKNFLNLYEARNEAIKKCSGKYICFLDTDDLWLSDKLQKQVLFMESNPIYSMVYSNYYNYFQEKKKTDIKYKNILPEGKITDKLLKHYFIGILTIMIKRKIFETNSFDSKLNVIGDFEFFISLSLEKKIGCIQKPLAIYRIHKNNFSKKNYNIYIRELSNWIKVNNKFFKNKGISLFYQKYFLFKLRIKNIIQKLFMIKSF